ncbi:hypothetical protein CDAR_398361 [Caerostris darwini]|uniref:CCHC-type domain-containing protein n=1 Tax=Caerostris darwini TaxID=1538125 RepID=A0AAV4QUS2_9ARAC|nr:hypothetical protein CDAR_398361 [Caerostris darwini]
MYEKECDFRPRQKFPQNDPTGCNKRTDPSFRNERFTPGSYNNKYSGHTQLRHSMQIDNNRCLACNENTHFARDCLKQKYKFDRMNKEQNFNTRGEGIERSEESHVSKRDHSLTRTSEDGLSKESSYIKIVRINKCPLKFTALIDTGSDSVICSDSVAKRLELKIDPASNVMYGFGNIKMCAARALGKAEVDISLDSVKLGVIDVLYQKNKEQKNPNTVDIETSDFDFEESESDNEDNGNTIVEKDIANEEEILTHQEYASYNL